MKKAILFMLLSTLAFTGMNVITKQMAHLPTFQIVFFRSIGSFVLASSYLLIKGIPYFGNQRKLLVLRAFLGLTAMSLFFMSLKELYVGTAVSLRYLSPIFATIFAVSILKERIRPVQLVFFLLAFLGVLILEGFDSNVSAKGLALVLTASVFSGMVYVVIRKIGKKDHPVVIVNYFMFFSALVGGILAIFQWVRPKGVEWIALVSLGLFGYFGQLYMTKAFQLAKTSFVAPFKYLEVVFTIGIGISWFGDFYSSWSLVGLLFILSAVVFNTLMGKKKVA